jgi:hypothetical protein
MIKRKRSINIIIYFPLIHQLILNIEKPLEKIRYENTKLILNEKEAFILIENSLFQTHCCCEKNILIFFKKNQRFVL